MERFPIFIYAYCIMPNHWHLPAQAQIPMTISRFMHWFGTTPASRYRKSHESVDQGAVYQNRFRSHPIHGSSAFLTTAAHIERNPPAAGLDSEATAWPWSNINERNSLPSSKWPYPKPESWQLLVAKPPEPSIVQQMQYSEISTQKFGMPDLPFLTIPRPA